MINRSTFRLMTLITAGLACTLLAGNVLAGPVQVELATPSVGEQASTAFDVTIDGNGFDEGSVASFLVTQTENPGGILVTNTRFVSRRQLVATIDIAEDADLEDYDIEVITTSGRRGKGHTLFSVVAPGSGGNGGGNECDLQFSAAFTPPSSDEALRGDGGPDYAAIGGTGFRLNTTGGANSDRKVIIDFSNTGNINGCDENAENRLNPGEAAGFCSELKDIDMRIERQVQQIDKDLCELNPVPDPNGEPDSFTRTFLVNFESGPMDDYSLVDPDRKGNPRRPESLKLNYGCQADLVEPNPSYYLNTNYRAVISRLDENTWLITGEWACLMTQTGWVLLDGSGDPVWFYMPFAVYLERTN